MKNEETYKTYQAKEVVNLMNIADLQRKLISINDLTIIENALWSMRSLVMEHQDVELKIKNEYSELFNIASTRLQEIKHILEP